MKLINVDSTIHDRVVSAAEAAKLLGVKRETLYAYASRGLLRSVPGERGKKRRYRMADVERLRARHEARSGHGAVAAGALRWGEPVLDSAITAIGEGGPSYRGRRAVSLAAEGATFEQVAELLWSGELPAAPSRWVPGEGPLARHLAALLPPSAPPLVVLSLLVPAVGALDRARFGATREAELLRVRALIARMATWLGGPPRDVDRASARPRSIAEAAARSLGSRRSPAALRAIDAALVLIADHELNASSFAARVTASTGADLYACIASGLAALGGPRHGGECDRVEALVAEVGEGHPVDVLSARGRRGEAIPGFSHRLYQAGDPRTPPLLDAARELAPKRKSVVRILALAAAGHELLGEPPTVDLGLVALCAALGAPPGSAAGLFALGRSAGWVAHALEQREAGYLLRPRARYVGPLRRCLPWRT